jgi:hypothetical protein
LQLYKLLGKKITFSGKIINTSVNKETINSAYLNKFVHVAEAAAVAFTPRKHTSQNYFSVLGHEQSMNFITELYHWPIRNVDIINYQALLL